MITCYHSTFGGLQPRESDGSDQANDSITLPDDWQRMLRFRFRVEALLYVPLRVLGLTGLLYNPTLSAFANVSRGLAGAGYQDMSNLYTEQALCAVIAKQV